MLNNISSSLFLYYKHCYCFTYRYAKEVRTLDNIENGRLLAKKIFKAENARKQALWRQEKGIGEEEELTPMALKKHGDPPSKVMNKSVS